MSQSIFTFLMNVQKRIRVLEKLALDYHLGDIIKANLITTSNNRTAFVETRYLSQMHQGIFHACRRCLKGIMGAQKTRYEGFNI